MSRIFYQIIILFALFSFTFKYGVSQSLKVTNAPPLTLQWIAQSIVGDNIVVLETTIEGMPAQVGAFEDSGINTGFKDGAILSTGFASDAVGPNNTNASQGFGNTSNDTLLLNLLEFPVGLNDQAKLIVKFIPLKDTINLSYIFASEEYPEYAPPQNNSYTDVMGIFLSGPEYPSPVNIAIIPENGDPVGIATINPVTNMDYYIDNTQVGSPLFETTAYDGLSKPIRSKISVTPCSEYTIVFTLADAGDGAFDSAILIEGSSFSATGNGEFEISMPKLNLSNLEVFEYCAEGGVEFTITRSDASKIEDYTLSTSGNATVGVDYSALPTDIHFEIGEFEKVFNVNIITDADNGEPDEFIDFILSGSEGCGGIIPQVSTKLTIKDDSTASKLKFSTLFTRQAVNENGFIVVNAKGGVGPYSFSINDIDFFDKGKFYPLTSGIYTVTVKDINNCELKTQVKI